MTDLFLARLLALLTPLGPVEARRLFGGHGLYLEGVIFAVVYDGALFLKADEGNRGDFARRGLGPLTYEGRGGKTIALPYWEAPASLLKSGAALRRWAAKAHAAGRRAQSRNAARKKPSRAKAAAPGPRRFEPEL